MPRGDNTERGKQGFQPTTRGKNAPAPGTGVPASAATPAVPQNAGEDTGKVWDRYQSTRVTDPNLCVRHGGNNFKTNLCSGCRDEWGELTVGRPPKEWGGINQKTEASPGVLTVSCEGHGGVKLSPARQKVIPEALRHGWYEEDCAINIVLMYHPDALPHNVNQLEDLDVIQERAENAVRTYFPEEYEKATGRAVPFGESYVADEKEWERLHGDKPVIDGDGARHLDLPGYVIVSTRSRYRGEQTTHLIPEKDWPGSKQTSFGAWPYAPTLVPDSAIDITVPMKPVPQEEPVPVTTWDPSRVSPSKRDLVFREMRQSWYNPKTGDQYTLADAIESGHAIGKGSYENGSREQYHIKTRDGIMPVSKATYDAYDAVDPYEQDRKDYARLNRLQNRMVRETNPEKKEKLSTQLDQLTTDITDKAHDKFTADTYSYQARAAEQARAQIEKAKEILGLN